MKFYNTKKFYLFLHCFPVSNNRIRKLEDTEDSIEVAVKWYTAKCA